MKNILPFFFCATIATLGLAGSPAAAAYVIPTVPAHDSTPAEDTDAASPGPKALLVVTTTDDSGPGSLRQAIADAATGDSIQFSLPLPAAIVLSSSLVIAKNLSILGPGPNQLTVMRDSATNTPSFRVIRVDAGTVLLTGLTLRNGRALNTTGADSNLGGAILNLGSLTVSNCVITGNTAPTEFGGGGFGAGIFSDGPLTVFNSTISGNYATYAGGGISTFHSGKLVMEGTTVSGNFAGIQGGGVNFQGLSGTLQNCTISGNSTPADGAGSGLLNICFGNEGSLLTLTACTIARNTGSTNAVFQIAALPTNLGLTNRLLSSLVASNDGPNFFLDGNPVLQTLGNNLDSDGTSGLVNGVNADLTGTKASPIDAKLGALLDNGGPTQTHALLTGSPAIGAGSCSDANGAPLQADQRGFLRPHTTGCDIGAFEFQALTLTCPADVLVEFSDETGATATFSATATSSCTPVNTAFTPPSGSVFPIGVTPVVVQATDGCGNSASCTFNVTVQGARGVKSNVLSQLTDLQAAATNPKDAYELGEAINFLHDSLTAGPGAPPLWLDDTHINPCSGGRVFDNEQGTVAELIEIIKYKKSAIPDATCLALIDKLVKADRLLAVVSIQDALNAGTKPKKLDPAIKQVAQGDKAVTQGKPNQAIQHYSIAWDKAVQFDPQ